MAVNSNTPGGLGRAAKFLGCSCCGSPRVCEAPGEMRELSSPWELRFPHIPVFLEPGVSCALFPGYQVMALSQVNPVCACRADLSPASPAGKPNPRISINSVASVKESKQGSGIELLESSWLLMNCGARRAGAAAESRAGRLFWAALCHLSPSPCPAAG